jgi:uncharacterized protein (TIGR03435 family)
MKASLAILAALGSGLLVAQNVAQNGNPPDANLQFEVASVRPSGPRQPGQPLMMSIAQGGPGTSDPEHLIYERSSFQRVLMDAYGVERDQLKGADWATSDAVNTAAIFDISAKIPQGATKQQVAIMLQNLLKERFKLELHHITVERSGFALVVAKGGPKLKTSAGPIDRSERNPTESGAVNLKVQKDGFPELFPGRNMGGTFQDGPVRIRFRDYPLSDLAQQTSFALNIRMVDKTGLNGKYDFTLEFVPPENAFVVAGKMTLPLAPGQQSPVNSEGPNPSQENSVPIISAAMEKQLGLKLEPAKIPVDTLVIDKAERTPAEN